MGGVEDTAAIGEAAELGRQRDKVEGFEIERPYREDAGGHLLPVGADVLDGSAADETRDACEAFDTGDTSFGDVKDEGVPIHSGWDLIGDACLPRHIVAVAIDDDGSRDLDVENEAVEAAVADEEVAAPAQDKERKAALAGEGDGFEKLVLAGNFTEIAGRAANAEGGVGGERDLLLDD